MEQTADDPVLMSRFRAGDSRAFTEIHALYYAAICNFANRLIQNGEQAKDIASDTFAKLWSRRQHFDKLINVKAFLYITVRNTCIDYLRDLQRREKRNEQMPTAELTNPLQQMAIAEFIAEVYREIEKLPKIQRTVLEMSYIHNQSTAQIAQKLGYKPDNIRQIKSRALAEIRRNLKQYLPTTVALLSTAKLLASLSAITIV